MDIAPAHRRLTCERHRLLLPATLAAFSMLVMAGRALANDPMNTVYLGDVEEGFLALGFGWRFGNSPYAATDTQLSEFSRNKQNTLPFYYYEGRHLFANGASFGAHLWKPGDLELDALFSFRFDRLEPEASEFYDGVIGRRQSLDGGLRLSWRQPWGQLSSQVLTDTLDRHNGTEADITYRYGWEGRRGRISPFASMIWQNQALLDYYYGIGPGEARPDLPAYTPEADTFFRIGVNTSYQASRNNNLFLNLSLTQVPDAAMGSALVDSEWQVRVMAGFTYTLGNLRTEGATRPAPDAVVPASRSEDLWSWRVLYGYTTEETFHKIHRGYIAPNKEVDTTLVGATVGRLMIDRTRLDLWGRLSFNRRLEGDFGNDTYDLNAYLMLMGTGYSPRSNRKLFRYGFGFGLSYVEAVPAVERIKQAEREAKTSRMLSYLEAQVDTPLTNLFGRRAPKNCYIGLTIVHRSGFFGSADIFDNTAGGSDVLGAHLECSQ